jgi:hypothetical protein
VTTDSARWLPTIDAAEAGSTAWFGVFGKAGSEVENVIETGARIVTSEAP